jgi:hypothetical protein
MHIRKVDHSIASSAMDQLYDLCYSSGRHDWTLKIPEMLAEAGFENVKLTEIGDAPCLARAFNEQHMLTVEEMATGMARAGKREMAVRMLKLVGDAHSEAVKGVALCIPRIVVLGRNPL